MKKLFAILLMIGSLTLVGCGGSGPGDAFTDFTKAMENGDTEKVKELAPAMSAAGEKLDGLVQQGAMEIKKKKGIDKVDITEEKIDGDTATIKFVIHYGDGTKDDEETAKLVKLKDKWTIDMGEEGKPMGGDGLGGPGAGGDFGGDPTDPTAPQ